MKMGRVRQATTSFAESVVSRLLADSRGRHPNATYNNTCIAWSRTDGSQSNDMQDATQNSDSVRCTEYGVVKTTISVPSTKYRA